MLVSCAFDTLTLAHYHPKTQADRTLLPVMIGVYNRGMRLNTYVRRSRRSWPTEQKSDFCGCECRSYDRNYNLFWYVLTWGLRENYFNKIFIYQFAWLAHHESARLLNECQLYVMKSGRKCNQFDTKTNCHLLHKFTSYATATVQCNV